MNTTPSPERKWKHTAVGSFEYAEGVTINPTIPSPEETTLERRNRLMMEMAERKMSGEDLLLNNFTVTPSPDWKKEFAEKFYYTTGSLEDQIDFISDLLVAQSEEMKKKLENTAKIFDEGKDKFLASLSTPKETKE